MNFMNQYGQVVTEDFAKRFVDHCHIGTRPKAVTKLALHHREGRFYVRPFVVALQKLVTLPHEEVIHVAVGAASPSGPTVAGAIRLKRDERQRSASRIAAAFLVLR